MLESGLPANTEEALERVKQSPSSSEGFAFLGNDYSSITLGSGSG